jgi:hypothetical protein
MAMLLTSPWLLLLSPLCRACAESGAFTSLSVRFADTLRGLHVGLLDGLKKENQPTVLTQILKTVAVLVVNTPYATMQQTASAINNGGGGATNEGGLLVPIVDHLLTHMLHEASSYHSASSSSKPTAVIVATEAHRRCH